MALLKLFLAMLAIALAAANYVAYSNGGQSGGGDVIAGPGGGDDDQSGEVDRPPTTTPPPPVTPPPPASAKLSWKAPLARENGDPIYVGEITGYRIRVEKQGTSTVQVKSVSGSTTTTTISLSGAGTYYFSIAAVDTTGVYSDYSGKVSKTVN